MYHIFLIHSSVDGLSGCFHVLVIVTSAAVNIGMHVSFLIVGVYRHRDLKRREREGASPMWNHKKKTKTKLQRKVQWKDLGKLREGLSKLDTGSSCPGSAVNESN